MTDAGFRPVSGADAADNVEVDSYTARVFGNTLLDALVLRGRIERDVRAVKVGSLSLYQHAASQQTDSRHMGGSSTFMFVGHSKGGGVSEGGGGYWKYFVSHM